MLGNWPWKVQQVRGEPVEAYGRRIVPVALVVSLGAGVRDRAGAGLVWARPWAVEVIADGQVERRPIPDVTLGALLALAAVGTLVYVVGRLLRKRCGTANACRR